MANQEQYTIQFQNAGQAKLYRLLLRKEFEATRYADELCMETLGLTDSVNYLLRLFKLDYLLSFKDPVYEQLTAEFLSSLELNPTPERVKFRLFNNDYNFSFDEIAEMWHFPHGEGVKDELPTQVGWLEAARTFWWGMTGKETNSFEGNRASLIQNPALRYFRQLLACTIFGRANSNKVNEKELYLLFTIISREKVNLARLIMYHMFSMVKSKGVIVFGGLITTLARMLNHGEQLSTLVPLDPRTIDLVMVRSMKLVKQRADGRFVLMIDNRACPDVILPDPARINVRDPANFRFLPDNGGLPAPMNQNAAIDAGESDEDEEEEREGPGDDAHNTHTTSGNFAGTSSRVGQGSGTATLDTILSEMRQRSILDAQRDQHVQDIQTRQTEMMMMMQQYQVDQRGLIDSMAGMTLRMDEYDDYFQQLGAVPPHQERRTRRRGPDRQ